MLLAKLYRGRGSREVLQGSSVQKTAGCAAWGLMNSVSSAPFGTARLLLTE